MSDEQSSLQPLKAVGGRRVIKNVSLLLGGRAINAPLSLVHIWLATHLLGSHGFGLVAMMYAFARTMSDLVDFQSWQTVLKYGLHPLTDGDFSGFQRVVAFSFLLDGIGGLIGCAGGIAISLSGMTLLGWPPEIHVIGVVFCVSILFMASATPTGLLSVFNRYDLISIQGVIATIVRVIGTAALTITGASVMALAVVWILAEVAAWTTLSIMALRELMRRNLIKGLPTELWKLLPDLSNGIFSNSSRHPPVRAGHEPQFRSGSDLQPYRNTGCWSLCWTRQRRLLSHCQPDCLWYRQTGLYHPDNRLSGNGPPMA